MEEIKYRYSLDRRFCGLQSWSRRSDEEKNSFPCRKSNPGRHTCGLFTVLRKLFFAQSEQNEHIVGRPCLYARVIYENARRISMKLGTGCLQERVVGQTYRPIFPLLYMNPKFNFVIFRRTRNTETYHIT
jgi:hypothetical protein